MMNLPPQIQQAMLRDPRFAMALQAQQTGSSTAPVGSWGEGLARMLQAPVGAMQGRRVANDYQGQADTYQKALSEGLAKYGQGDSQGAMTAMGQSPYALETGTQLAMQDAMTRRQSEILATRLAAQGEQADQRFAQQSERDAANRAADAENLDKRLALQAELANQRTEAVLARLGMQGGPAALQEWDAYQKMTPEQQEEYRRMKRADPSDALRARIELGGDAKAAEAGGAIRGKSDEEARLELPQVESQTEASMAIVDEMIKHPGLSAAVGVRGPTNWLRGTDAAGFKAYVDQIGGQQFLAAFESLKGGGHITEIEGQKATQAIARMTNTAQSEKEWKKAAEEYKEILLKGLVRARQKVSAQPAPPVESLAPNRERLRFNPVTGELE